MHRSQRGITRRDFLKLSLLNLAAAALPGRMLTQSSTITPWPVLRSSALPEPLQRILSRVPASLIGEDGYLRLLDAQGDDLGRVPQARTQWNIEKSQPYDRLMDGMPWGLVLHWYEEPDGDFEDRLDRYLGGFNGLRRVEDYYTRTSAHFLVGDMLPVDEGEIQERVGIAQIQAPDADGTPFVASHLRFLDYRVGYDRQQYFIRALDLLEEKEPGIHSMLQDFYAGPKIDPGYRTIAIEISGRDFDEPGRLPSEQKIANVLSVVCAVMKRYRIYANDVMGHLEIDIQKTDPGKQFMAYIRLLLAVKALVDQDPEMFELVFGRFNHSHTPLEGVLKYLAFIRDYLVLVARPTQVYRWEVQSKYWLLVDLVSGKKQIPDTGNRFIYPLRGSYALKGDNFLNPGNHEGVDLYPQDAGQSSTPVFLVADGVCLFVGRSYGYCPGLSVVFRHRQPDGSEILTFYGHLSEVEDLQVGSFYYCGRRIGKVQSYVSYMGRYLHFAIAYGAVWEAELSSVGYVPVNVNAAWISERFLSPLEYLAQQMILVDETPRNNRLRVR
jgi:hypothetical protein